MYTFNCNYLYISFFFNSFMKGLIKKVLAPLAVAGTLFATNLASAEIKPFVSISIGGYNGFSQSNTHYGSMFRIKGAAGLDLSKNFRIEGALTYMDYKFKDNLNVLVGEAVVYGMTQTESVNIRAGIGLCAYGENVNGKDKKTAIGPALVLVGIDKPINKKTDLYVDIGISIYSIITEGTLRGGNSFDMGIRRFIK